LVGEKGNQKKKKRTKKGTILPDEGRVEGWRLISEGYTDVRSSSRERV